MGFPTLSPMLTWDGFGSSLIHILPLMGPFPIMISFQFAGIPVRIEPWFWITLFFLGGGLHITGSQDLIYTGLFMLAGFMSIFVHELGHALTVNRFGLPSAIRLVAFGGVAIHPDGVLNRKQTFLVSAAGPGVQAILGIIAVVVSSYLPMPEHSLLRVLLFYLVWISFIWAGFNCMPVFPLDGGQMLATVLGEKRKRWLFITGMAFAAGMGVLAYLYIGSWVIPLFMAYFVWINWQGFQKEGR